jgi:uncharacterized membrane protein YvbJ
VLPDRPGSFINAASTQHQPNIFAASTQRECCQQRRIDTTLTQHRFSIDTASTQHRRSINATSTQHRHIIIIIIIIIIIVIVIVIVIIIIIIIVIKHPKRHNTPIQKKTFNSR